MKVKVNEGKKWGFLGGNSVTCERTETWKKTSFTKTFLLLLFATLFL